MHFCFIRICRFSNFSYSSGLRIDKLTGKLMKIHPETKSVHESPPAMDDPATSENGSRPEAKNMQNVGHKVLHCTSENVSHRN